MSLWSDIRRRLRPEEALALLYVLPFAWIALRHSTSVHINYTTVLAFFAPALMIGISLWLNKRSGAVVWQTVRDFLPFALAVCVYENLHQVTTILHWPDCHEWLIAADECLFGGINPVVWMQRWTHPRLTDLMTLAYTTYYFYPPILALRLYRRGQRAEFRDAMLALALTFYLGYLGYVLVPAMDPWITMQERFTVTLEGSPITNQALTLYTISNLKVPRDCFPSLHTAVSLVVLVFAWRSWRRFFWAALPCVTALLLSTIYLRLHYVIDLVAAVPLVMVTVWSAPRLNHWWFSARLDAPPASCHNADTKPA